MAKTEDNGSGVGDSFFDIDPRRLDEEWFEHPRRTRLAAEEVAEARRDMARAEAALEVAKADVAKLVRARPGKFGLDKATEGGVKEAVTTHPKVRRAQEAVINAEYRHNMCKAALAALNVKKSGLQDSVQLWAMGYFAGPKSPKNLRELTGKLERDAAFRRHRKGEDED